jgi:anti-sigma factor RsiW
MAERPQGQRQIAGLWCGDVLEGLPDYLEGALPPAVVQAVEAHLQGCDWCARFGGEYAGTVQRLQRALAEPDPLDDELARRLEERLARELGK